MSEGLGLLIAQGKIGEYSKVSKFGRNFAIGTSFSPLTIGGAYESPQVSAATPLRVKAGNTNDTALGTGARAVTLTYLDTSLTEQTETLATAGTSASDYTSGSVFRLLSFKVSASGTYASLASGFSHAADIVIEDSGGTVWGTIDSTDIARGRSQVGIYTIPLTNSQGRTVKEAYLTQYTITSASNKEIDFILLERANVLETSAPYTQASIIREHSLNSDSIDIKTLIPLGPFAPGTDVGWLAKAATSAVATVDMEFCLNYG